MKLLHYTSEKIDKLKTLENTNFLKPTGLWLSVNDEWEIWCKENGFSTYNSDNCWVYEYVIEDSANIIVLKNVDDIINFTDKYSKDFGINWSDVYKDYDGIGFLNYQETKSQMHLNLKSTWYYAIDINCYCIWNVSILNKINCEKIDKKKELVYYNCD